MQTKIYLKGTLIQRQALDQISLYIYIWILRNNALFFLQTTSNFKHECHWKLNDCKMNKIYSLFFIS